MAETTQRPRKVKAKKEPRGRGFLPFQTNTFDRYFVSVVIAIALGLVYLRFLEPLGVPAIVSWVVVIALGFFIVRKG